MQAYNNKKQESVFNPGSPFVKFIRQVPGFTRIVQNYYFIKRSPGCK